MNEENKLSFSTNNYDSENLPYITFHDVNTGDVLGKFFTKEGVLCFEGKTDECATILVEQVLNKFNLTNN